MRRLACVCLWTLVACAAPESTYGRDRAVLTHDTIDRNRHRVLPTDDGTPVDDRGQPLLAPCIAGCERLARPGEHVTTCRLAKAWPELSERFELDEGLRVRQPLVCFFSGE
jgi:hypothetical protein